MLNIPDESNFSGPNRDESMPENMKSHQAWLNIIKTTGCIACHGIGTLGTRTIPPRSAISTPRQKRGRGASSPVRRRPTWSIRSTALDPQLAFQYFGDWTDRIAKGELPFAQPPRPQGIERNIVVTLWDWSRPTAYMHDLTPTDRRNPTVNANGKLYGTTEDSTDYLPVLDPAHNSSSEIKHPVRDPNTPTSKTAPMEPSPYWGAEPIWDSQTTTHNPMMDEKGRVWFTARVRPPANPDFCKQGSSHPSAQVFPLQEANRHLSMYDPASGKFTLISTCFPTHHLNFADRRQPDAVDKRRRAANTGGRLAQPQDVRGDRRRAEIAGLGAVHPRHQRQRQARRLCRAQPAGGPDQGQARRRRPLFGVGKPGRRYDLGHFAGISRLCGSCKPGARSDAYGADRDL